MTPIPGEPLHQDDEGLTLPDGRKVKLKVPGLAPRPQPKSTGERGAEEPPRDDPRPPVNPDTTGF